MLRGVLFGAYICVYMHVSGGMCEGCVCVFRADQGKQYRRIGYEFFKATHFLAAVVFMLVFFWHCAGTLTSW